MKTTLPLPGTLHGRRKRKRTAGPNPLSVLKKRKASGSDQPQDKAKVSELSNVLDCHLGHSWVAQSFILPPPPPPEFLVTQTKQGMSTANISLSPADPTMHCGSRKKSDPLVVTAGYKSILQRSSGSFGGTGFENCRTVSTAASPAAQTAYCHSSDAAYLHVRLLVLPLQVIPSVLAALILTQFPTRFGNGLLKERERNFGFCCATPCATVHFTTHACPSSKVTEEICLPGRKVY